MELLVSHTRHAQPGVTETTTRISTPQPDDSSDETIVLNPPKTVGRFKTPARPTSHKDTDELRYRVSFISEVGIVALTIVLQDVVRKHANKMMGRTRNDKAEPAPKEAIDKYKSTGKEEDGPSKDRFQADFSEARPEKSPWNIRLTEIFVDDYVQGGCPVGQLGVKDISNYFLTYLRSLRTTYRNRTTASSTGRGTVQDDVSKRNRIDKRKVSVRCSSWPCDTHHTDSFYYLPAVP